MVLQRPLSSNCAVLHKTLILKYGESLPYSLGWNFSKLHWNSHYGHILFLFLFLKMRFHSGTTQPLRGLEAWIILQLCSVLASVLFDDFRAVRRVRRYWRECPGILTSAGIPSRELCGIYRSLVNCTTNKFLNQSQWQKPVLPYKSSTDCTLEGSEFSNQLTFREINSDTNMRLQAQKEAYLEWNYGHFYPVWSYTLLAWVKILDQMSPFG